MNYPPCVLLVNKLNVAKHLPRHIVWQHATKVNHRQAYLVVLNSNSTVNQHDCHSDR